MGSVLVRVFGTAWAALKLRVHVELAPVPVYSALFILFVRRFIKFYCGIYARGSFRFSFVDGRGEPVACPVTTFEFSSWKTLICWNVSDRLCYLRGPHGADLGSRELYPTPLSPWVPGRPKKRHGISHLDSIPAINSRRKPGWSIFCVLIWFRKVYPERTAYLLIAFAEQKLAGRTAPRWWPTGTVVATRRSALASTSLDACRRCRLRPHIHYTPLPPDMLSHRSGPVRFVRVWLPTIGEY